MHTLPRLRGPSHFIHTPTYITTAARPPCIGVRARKVAIVQGKATCKVEAQQFMSPNTIMIFEPERIDAVVLFFMPSRNDENIAAGGTTCFAVTATVPPGHHDQRSDATTTMRGQNAAEVPLQALAGDVASVRGRAAKADIAATARS